MRTFPQYFIASNSGRTAVVLLAIALIGELKAGALYQTANSITTQQPGGNLAEAAFAATFVQLPSLLVGVVGVGFLVATVVRYRQDTFGQQRPNDTR